MTVHDDLALLLNAGRTSPPLRDAVLRVEAEIAQLEARAASWQASCEAAREDFETAFARAGAAEARAARLRLQPYETERELAAEVARLRDGLRRIADEPPPQAWADAAEIARALLADQDGAA